MDYETDDLMKPPVPTTTTTSKDVTAIKSRTLPATRRSKRSTYPASKLISSMRPASKIQYPSAMQIGSLGILDSPPSAPPSQFIISASPPPNLASSQKEGTAKMLMMEEKEKMLENILETLIDLSRKKMEKMDAEKYPTAPTTVGSGSMNDIPIVGQKLNGLAFKDTLVNFGGKMIGALHPRYSRQSSPGGGAWDSSAASKWMGGGSSWPSGQGASSGGQRRSTFSQSRQSGAVMPSASAQSAPPAQASPSGGPPPSFWEQFSSMFGSASAGAGGAGQAPPAQGSQTGAQSGQALADPQSSVPPQQGAPPGSAQASPPSWSYSPQPAPAAQPAPGWAPAAPSTQSNQRKRGLGDYGPMHGGVSLSNIPYTESGMPFQSAPETISGSKMGDSSNIPSMSFSINPPSMPQPIEPVRRMPVQVDLDPEPSYVLAKRPVSLAPNSMMINYPPRVEVSSVPEPSYIYLDQGTNCWAWFHQVLLSQFHILIVLFFGMKGY